MEEKSVRNSLSRCFCARALSENLSEFRKIPQDLEMHAAVRFLVPSGSSQVPLQTADCERILLEITGREREKGGENHSVADRTSLSSRKFRDDAFTIWPPFVSDCLALAEV